VIKRLRETFRLSHCPINKTSGLKKKSLTIHAAERTWQLFSFIHVTKASIVRTIDTWSKLTENIIIYGSPSGSIPEAIGRIENEWKR
jgi:hypothetical protein